jgi:tripartite-type tricarboxylate transporter receptor subunit TctC
LIALAKASPNQLRHGSTGIGSPHHLAGEIFKTMAGVKMVHVPYRGATPAFDRHHRGTHRGVFRRDGLDAAAREERTRARARRDDAEARRRGARHPDDQRAGA